MENLNDFLEISDEEEEDIIRLKTENLSVYERKVAKLLNHQASAKLSYVKTVDSALFFNSDSSVSLPDSKYKIKQIAKQMREKTFKLKYSKLYICDKCSELYEIICICGKSNKKNAFMIKIGLEQQLRHSIFEHFDEIMLFMNRDKSEGIISDTDNGILFHKLKQKHKHSTVLSLMLNIDGAAIYNTTKKSLWLIQVYQNFLPPSIRFKAENVLLLGLYYGSKKPDVFDFMYPLAKELDELQESQINVHSTHDNTFHNFIPYITIACCDLPAKQMLQNFVALSGRNSCSFCDHPGESVPNAKFGSTIRYVHRENCKERTHEETLKISGTMRPEQDPIKGIKGPSVMQLFNEFDVIDSFAIDFMHGMGLGITNHFIEIIIEKKRIPNAPYANYKISSVKKRLELNKRILQLKPYSGISKKPRSIFEVSNFKAKELFCYLWFYITF